MFSDDSDACIKMFNDGKTTSQVQEFLMNKYHCNRAKTSNFVKKIRMKMGIYNSVKPKSR